MFLRKPVAPYKAINLSQTNDYLAYSSDTRSELEHTDTFTISFWYYLFAGVPANVPYQISKFTNGDITQPGWGCFVDTGERMNLRMVESTGGAYTIRTGTVTPAGEWTHYVIQKIGSDITNSSNYRFFNNGHRNSLTVVTATFNTGGTMVSTSNLIFGDAPGTASRNSTGRFKDFRLYKNKVLSEYEIRRLYDLGRNQYKTYSFYMNDAPDIHLMRDPGIYSTHPTTNNLMFRDEISKQFSLSGINLTSTTQVIVSNENPNASLSSMTSVIRCKPSTFGSYDESLDVSYLYGKTANPGVSYSRAASNQKVVGNFRVRFRNLVFATSTRHMYIGLHSGSTIPAGPNNASLFIAAGFNNGGYMLYSAGTTVGSAGAAISDRTATLSVDYDRNLVETYFEDDSGAILPTWYFSCTTEHIGSRTCYVIPYTLYNTSNREIYYMFWDFMNIPNPGYLAPNNLI